MKQSGRFVITESNTTTTAYCFDDWPDESIFSYYFFNRLSCGDSGTSAYNSAKSSLILFYETYIEGEEGEGGIQMPMKNDQIAYTWFEWW